jgi:uncharacterized membrane protein
LDTQSALNTTLPSMLRDELFHPAVVHFPVAFLATSGLLALIWFFFRRGHTTLLILLTLGTIGGWLGILTGGWAEDVVNKVICDPTVTHEHEKWAEWAVWSASFALPFVAFAKLKKAPSVFLRTLCTLPLMFASGAVLYAGHLGASLVYQQGAAVYKPAPQCTEFE